MPQSIINDFAHQIPSSPTYAMAERAAALKKEGKDIINLSVGELDIPMPEWIQKAAIDAIQKGSHLYTPIAGLPELREAVVEKLRRENHLEGYTASQIIVGTGAKQVLYNALMVSLSPDDEVILPAPYWVSYPAMVSMSGGKVVPVVCPMEDDFKLSASALRQAITPRTRWLLLNSPSNPSGALYTEAELGALAEVLCEHPHVWVLSDDIYEHLTYDNSRFASILSVEPSLRGRTLLVNGLSKSFAMTGWRVGYGAGPIELIQAMSKLQSQSTSGACCIAQWAAVSALTNPEKSTEFFAQVRQIYAKRRDILRNGLPSEMPVTNPPGAFYLYPNVREIMRKKGMNSDIDLATNLLEEGFVSSVPGSEFGAPGYLRLSYAVPEAMLQKAIEYLHRWVAL